MGSGQCLRGPVPKDRASFSFQTRSVASTQPCSHPPPTRSCPVPSPDQQRPRPSEQTPACTCPASAHCRITHLCFSLFYINVIVLHASVCLTSLAQSVIEGFSILPCVHLACGFAFVCSLSQDPRSLSPHEVLWTVSPPHPRSCPGILEVTSPPPHPGYGAQTHPRGPRLVMETDA